MTMCEKHRNVLLLLIYHFLLLFVIRAHTDTPNTLLPTTTFSSITGILFMLEANDVSHSSHLKDELVVVFINKAHL